MNIFENELPEGFYVIGKDPYKGKQEEVSLGCIYIYQRDDNGNKEDYLTKYYG